MPCFYPINAWQPGPEQPVTFKHQPDWSFIRLPCGRCIGCAISKAIDWKNRLVHESKFHEHAYFLTCTYSPEQIRPDYSLDKSQFKRFMYRLRKHYGPGVRFFNAAEYGSITSRPHHHPILFGLEIEDLEHIKNNSRGDPLYRSDTLEKLWTHGQVLIGHFSPEAARYVASHTEKTIKAVGLKHMKVFDPVNQVTKWLRRPYTATNPETGEVTERVYPYTVMSNRPGIGKKWIETYYQDCRSGYLVMKTDPTKSEYSKAPIPRYYMQKIKELDPDQYQNIYQKRLDYINSVQAQFEQSDERLDVRKFCLEARLKSGKRGTRQDQVPHDLVLPTQEELDQEKWQSELANAIIERVYAFDNRISHISPTKTRRPVEGDLLNSLLR